MSRSLWRSTVCWGWGRGQLGKIASKLLTIILNNSLSSWYPTFKSTLSRQLWRKLISSIRTIWSSVQWPPTYSNGERTWLLICSCPTKRYLGFPSWEMRLSNKRSGWIHILKSFIKANARLLRHPVKFRWPTIGWTLFYLLNK